MVDVVSSAPFPFEGTQFPDNLGAVVQNTVANGELPALIVVHDDENEWLIGDGINEPAPDVCGIYHLRHIIEIDPTLKELVTLPIGYVAERDSKESAWSVSEWTYEDG